MLDSHATFDNKNSFKEVITNKIKIAIFKNNEYNFVRKTFTICTNLLIV